MPSGGEVEGLRDEVARLLAAALQSDRNHTADLLRVEQLHEEELLALADVAAVEATRLKAALDDVENLKKALASRDVIGQAKGVIMAAMGCSADTAFELLSQTSQNENRKLVEVAREIAARAQRGRN
jgi:AmiR/NasT family two-component response regulator